MQAHLLLLFSLVWAKCLGKTHYVLLSYSFTAVYTYHPREEKQDNNNCLLFSAQGTLPTAVLQPALTILAIGGDVTFSCTTTEADSATWMHNNAIIDVDANHIINTSDQLFELVVFDFSSDLTGNYTCVATNDAGSVSSSTAVLELAGESSIQFNTALGLVMFRACRTLGR